MSDDEDWESFSVPTFAAVAPAAPADDEEDLTLLEQPTVSAPSASQQEAAKKKAAQEAEALASRVEFALLENETPEEKKIRERRQAEEAEARMVANDLGGSATVAAAPRASATSGIASIPLKNKKDHETFAITVANKLSGSTAVCSTAFMAELATRIKANITTEGLDALIASLQTTRDSRKKVEQVKTKKSKKEILKEQKAHADKYGGADDDYGAYDEYSHMEDDFM